MSRIYVASSWCNPRQQAVVKSLREAGFEVYDFRNPKEGNTGFHWSDIDPEWEMWSPERFKEALYHPIALKGFALDMDALGRADATVCVMPCGRSAHLELGWAIGHGQRSAILLSYGEPELMYAMADIITPSLAEIVAYLEETG